MGARGHGGRARRCNPHRDGESPPRATHRAARRCDADTVLPRCARPQLGRGRRAGQGRVRALVPRHARSRRALGAVCVRVGVHVRSSTASASWRTRRQRAKRHSRRWGGSYARRSPATRGRRARRAAGLRAAGAPPRRHELRGGYARERSTSDAFTEARAVGPGLAPRDSRLRAGLAPARRTPCRSISRSGWSGTGGRINSVRTRAVIEVVSPDSARSLDFDSYLDFGRGPDGNPRVRRRTGFACRPRRLQGRFGVGRGFLWHDVLSRRRVLGGRRALRAHRHDADGRADGRACVPVPRYLRSAFAAPHPLVRVYRG